MKNQMKFIRSLFIIINVFFIITIFTGCNHRPDFPMQNNESQTQSTSTKLNKLTFDKNIEVVSTTLKHNSDDTFTVESGSSIKINITLPTIYSIDNKSFYFNKETNSIINAVKLNLNIIPLNDLSNYFIINSDSNISLVESEINFSSVLICHKYSTGASDTLYKKFNYKSNNFRNSLIKFENEKIKIDNSIFYITFNNIDSNLTTTKNIASNIKSDKNSLNIETEIFYETTEVSICFAYADANNNLFLSDVYNINNFDQLYNFEIIDNTYNLLNIKFSKNYIK